MSYSGRPAGALGASGWGVFNSTVQSRVSDAYGWEIDSGGARRLVNVPWTKG